MNKTLEELLEADRLVAKLYSKEPTLKDGKFGYAWKRFYAKNITPVLTEMQEKTQDAYIDNALEDPKTKELLKDGDNYKYSKEGMKNLTEQIRTITKEYQAKEIEVEPYISSSVPEMTDEQKDVLTGLVI